MTVKHSNSPSKIRMGSRGSPLALAQVDLVTAALKNVAPDIEIESVVIKTSGDWKVSDGEVALSADSGGKAQFAKEIEEALLAGAIDCAVHSMKDMETVLPDGLVIEHMLPREDARDAVLSASGQGLDNLPKGAVVGTVSPRRAAFLRSMRSDLEIVPLRGNVQTRIDKMKSGQVDATLLACAGLNRLGLSDVITDILDTDIFVPAGGQGAVGIELRFGDEYLFALFDQISCRETVMRVSAEREVLRVLDGSCHTPIGVHAKFDGEEMIVRARFVSPDGAQDYIEGARGVVKDKEAAQQLGAKIGRSLKEKIPTELLAAAHG